MMSGKSIAKVVLGLGAAVLLVGAAVAQEQTAPEQQTYEGTVKVGLGKYMYLPQARGFDIVTEGFDAGTLVGQEVRVKGALLTDRPSIFRADSIEVKDASGSYTSAYTRTQDVTFDGFLDQEGRSAFAALAIANVNRAEDWEGKGQAKVYGRIQEGDPTSIVLADDKGKEIGRVIVDSMTDYAKFYLQKLHLFDKFWFYLSVKESVERRARARTKELFHADVVFAGLF
ncbi:MAG: hypothetical protein OEW05_07405 [Candidatus Aminicenantes bacterium]|nr:hypothetical protein [Candidatus Aminicenantes bacterium]